MTMKSVSEIDEPNHLQETETLKIFEQREALRIKLLGKRHCIPKYLSGAANEVDTLLKQTVIQKENHSVVLIGPRNSYKTTCIQQTLGFLNKEHASEFIVIHLNGMLHFEQHAIKSIANQMEQQLKKLESLRRARLQTTHPKSSASLPEIVEPQINMTQGSLAEVFQRFLQILDHSHTAYTGLEPSSFEHGSSDDENDTDDVGDSKRDKISIIFIFDEIDLFAGPVRQTILYNLFDMVENSPISFCIIGLTTKLNLLEYFEKRVKSRFSNRTINFFKPGSFDEFQQSFTKILKIEEPDNQVEEEWNEELMHCFKTPDSQYNEVLRKNYDTVKDINLLWNGFIHLFSKKNFTMMLEDGSFYSTVFHGFSIVERYEIQRFKSTWRGRLSSLSDLEMIVLVSTARVSLKNNDCVTFSNIYNEYSHIISNMNKNVPSMASFDMFSMDKTYKLWAKTDIKNVWESLIRLGFLIERGALGLRDSAFQAFVVSNYQTFQHMVPFDLRVFNSVITLHELRQFLPTSSSLYTWSQI